LLLLLLQERHPALEAKVADPQRVVTVVAISLQEAAAPRMLLLLLLLVLMGEIFTTGPPFRVLRLILASVAAAHPRKTTPRILQAPPVPAAPVPAGEEDQWQGAPQWNEGAAVGSSSFFTQGGEQQQAPSCHKEVPVRQRQPWQQLGVQAVAP
jgi:hypothetical protein